MPSLLLMLVSLSHWTPATWSISSISSHLHLGIDPQTSAWVKLSNVTKHSFSLLAFHLSVIWNHNIQHSSWQNNTVTWLTQHIGNAQEWGGIWPPSLQTPSYASVSAAQRKRRAAQPPEEEMTWWQKCYNVAPVKTMPTLKRGVVLCWVGTMFFM